eukprot:2771845-Amphidinium_carterae.1
MQTTRNLKNQTVCCKYDPQKHPKELDCQKKPQCFSLLIKCVCCNCIIVKKSGGSLRRIAPLWREVMDKVLEEAKAKLQPLCDAKGFISGHSPEEQIVKPRKQFRPPIPFKTKD